MSGQWSHYFFYPLYSNYQEYPEYVAYRTPLIFCDDWLNMYLDHFRLHKDPESYQKDNDICCSDYRFVYMGAKGLSIDILNLSLLLFGLASYRYVVFVFAFNIDTQFPLWLVACLTYGQVPKFIVHLFIFSAGSWTPLHADVFRSYSWSANVCGKKKWLFLSPSQCHLVFDRQD